MTLDKHNIDGVGGFSRPAQLEAPYLGSEADG